MAPIPGPKPLSLEFEGDRFSGSAGVNRFMGQIGDEAPFPLVATTLMAGPENLMTQEQVFLRLLESVDTIEASENGMFLLADGLVIVTLISAGTESTPRNVQ